jgi:Zn-dependent protease/predicted transcriptional regulator
MRGGISIGKVLGIQLKLHYSWFLIFALVTWALVASYYPTTYPNWTLSMKIAAGLITSLLFFGSVLFHEMMHSVVAIHEGIPIQGITLFILGGVSEMTDEPKTAKDEFRMAIAGPGSSLVLGGIFWGIWFALRGSTVNSVQFVAGIAYWLGYINLALGVFNLIPGFPLDGGRVFRSILWWRSGKLHRATKIASNIGRAVGFLFILGGIYLVFTGNWLNGIWFALIGWFLESAAAGSYRQLLLQELLKGHVASEIMTRDCQTVSPDLTIEKLVNENVLASGRRCFPVAEGGRVEGLVTVSDVQRVPRDQWNMKPVRDAMTPLEKLKSVKPDEDLNTVLKTLAQNDINQVPVVQDRNIVGIVARDSILNFINLRAQLAVDKEG